LPLQESIYITLGTNTLREFPSFSVQCRREIILRRKKTGCFSKVYQEIDSSITPGVKPCLSNSSTHRKRAIPHHCTEASDRLKPPPSPSDYFASWSYSQVPERCDRPNDSLGLEIQRGIFQYIDYALALTSVKRKVGGTQFRHGLATLAILIEYGCTDPIILKAAPIHDLIEDTPPLNIQTISGIDSDGESVLRLVLELTRSLGETKQEYLARLRDSGTLRAKILKIADRISNITDLHLGIFSPEKVRQTLEETKHYVLPIAEKIHPRMADELRGLVIRRYASFVLNIKCL